MKKLSGLAIFFLLSLVLLGLNPSPAGAYDPGCAAGNIYSTVTGILCSQQAGYYSGATATTLIPGCDGYSKYNIYTGAPCSYYQSGFEFTRELSRGSRGADVTVLQEYLRDLGYFFGRVDGVYGSITKRAVLDFQTDNDLPQTGRADWQTLSILKSSVPIPPVSPVNPVYPCYPYYSGNSYLCGGAPTISGVSGPQYLSASQEGTWTVNASGTSAGALYYSVDWGEYQIFPYGAQYQSPLAAVQQTATFTHRYSNPGTYTATFTVTNMQGASAKTTITVNVSGSTQSAGPILYSLSPSSGRTGTLVTIYGSNLSGSLVYFNEFPQQPVFQSDTIITFTVPYSLNNCLNGGYECSMFYTPMNPGMYGVRVIKNNNLVSNRLNFQLTY